MNTLTIVPQHSGVGTIFFILFCVVEKPHIVTFPTTFFFLNIVKIKKLYSSITKLEFTFTVIFGYTYSQSNYNFVRAQY